jgi:putative flippase GtrA
MTKTPIRNSVSVYEQIRATVMSVLRLRQQFFRFIMVGALNFLIGALVLNLLAWLAHSYSGPMLLAFYVAAFTVAVTHSYLWNRSWTFKSGRGSKSSYPLFYTLTLIGSGLGAVIVFAMTTYVPAPLGLSGPVWLNAANVVAALFGLFWNFTTYRQFVFRSPAVEAFNQA